MGHTEKTKREVKTRCLPPVHEGGYRPRSTTKLSCERTVATTVEGDRFPWGGGDARRSVSTQEVYIGSRAISTMGTPTE